MNDDEVLLSRASGQVAELLTLETRIAFTEAIMRARSLADVPEPYRGWLQNPSSIPSKHVKRRVSSDPRPTA